MNTSLNDSLTLHGKVYGEGEFLYKVNTQWCQFDAELAPVENCHDMAMDSQGRIYMVTDHPKNNILVINQDGTLVDAFCTQFPGAHAIRIVEEQGVEYIYLVDSGWKINRNWDGVSTQSWDSPYNKVVAQNGCVAKLTLNGEVEFIIGHPQTIGVYEAGMAFRPTDIVISENGDLYVTDGYGSDFVIQYNACGQYIRHWGGHQNIDNNYNLINTHGIEIIIGEDNNPMLVVSSRAEMQYKCFSLTGKYIKKIDMSGAWVGRLTKAGDHFLVPICWSDIDGENKAKSGFLSILDKHFNVVANIGGKSLADGRLQTTWDLFQHVHGICFDEQGNIYVGQWQSGGSYPFKLERC